MKGGIARSDALETGVRVVHVKNGDDVALGKRGSSSRTDHERKDGDGDNRAKHVSS